MPPENNQLLWVKYYCGGALMAYVVVSPLTELAHRRLCDFHWQTGQWPQARTGNAAALCRVTENEWPQVAAQLPALGWRTLRGRLTNHDVHRVRAEAVTFLRGARKKARMAATRRWSGSPAQGTGTSPGGRLPLAARQPELPQVPPRKSAGCSKHAPSNAPRMHIHGTDSTDSKFSGKDAERLTLNVSPLKKCAKAEPEFLEQLVLMLTRWNPQAVEPELTNWGGWWRKRYRENPDKARRVLAEVGCLVKEGRITRSPGSAAVDLWKRLP